MKKVLLSFDIEEFDMPLEYGKKIEFEKQISVSSQGTRIILDILKQHKIQATFFSTVVFASNAQPLVDELLNDGHELASHGYYHSSFEIEHLLKSKNELEKISGRPIAGYRMARMMPVENQAIASAGYTYNSSLNPVYLPGRYNNFFKPRTIFKTNSLIQLPASAVPVVRFPLFWLSFHNLPLWLYKQSCKRTMNSDGYLNLYFHPWEFTDLAKSEYGFPGYVSKNSGSQMINRFNSLIEWMKKQNYSFSTITNFLKERE
jgi:peptidoglycan/xylan/chitin deacetylase (PgdA/CDA1 family)